MAQPRSPQEVFLALVNGVADGRLDELPDLYAEQTDVVHPFDPLRAPALRSRDEIRAHFGHRRQSAPPDAAPRPPRPHRRVANVTIHQTTDPEVIVAEFEYQEIADGTGEPTVLPAIFVLRVRDGEIGSSRDYHDHITSARARGQLDELFAAIKTQDGAARIDAQT